MHAFIQIASHLHTYHLSSAALSPLLPQELMQNSGQRALGAAVFYDAAHKIAQSVRSFRRRPWKGFWDQIRKILLGVTSKSKIERSWDVLPQCFVSFECRLQVTLCDSFFLQRKKNEIHNFNVWIFQTQNMSAPCVVDITQKKWHFWQVKLFDC